MRWRSFRKGTFSIGIGKYEGEKRVLKQCWGWERTGLELDPAVEMPLVGFRELFCLFLSQKELCWQSWAVGASIPQDWEMGSFPLEFSFPLWPDPFSQVPKEVGQSLLFLSSSWERGTFTHHWELRHFWFWQCRNFSEGSVLEEIPYFQIPQNKFSVRERLEEAVQRFQWKAPVFSFK